MLHSDESILKSHYDDLQFDVLRLDHLFLIQVRTTHKRVTKETQGDVTHYPMPAAFLIYF